LFIFVVLATGYGSDQQRLALSSLGPLGLDWRRFLVMGCEGLLANRGTKSGTPAGYWDRSDGICRSR